MWWERPAFTIVVVAIACCGTSALTPVTIARDEEGHMFPFQVRRVRSAHDGPLTRQQEISISFSNPTEAAEAEGCAQMYAGGYDLPVIQQNTLHLGPAGPIWNWVDFVRVSENSLTLWLSQGEEPFHNEHPWPGSAVSACADSSYACTIKVDAVDIHLFGANSTLFSPSVLSNIAEAKLPFEYNVDGIEAAEVTGEGPIILPFPPDTDVFIRAGHIAVLAHPRNFTRMLGVMFLATLVVFAMTSHRVLREPQWVTLFVVICDPSLARKASVLLYWVAPNRPRLTGVILLDCLWTATSLTYPNGGHFALVAISTLLFALSATRVGADPHSSPSDLALLASALALSVTSLQFWLHRVVYSTYGIPTLPLSAVFITAVFVSVVVAQNRARVSGLLKGLIVSLS